jgi:hypothetical protein
MGWAPLQPASRTEPAWPAHDAPLSHQPLAPVTDPQRARRAQPVIEPRRLRYQRPQPRRQRTHDQPPSYRGAPLDEMLLDEPPPLLLPPPDPSLRPADPQHVFAPAGSDAALTVLDLRILDDIDPTAGAPRRARSLQPVLDLPILDDVDAMAGAPRRASFLEPTYLHLLGATFLHVAGLLTQGDPEVYVEAEVALYSSMVLMLWCVIRIFRRAARERPRRPAAAIRSAADDSRDLQRSAVDTL